MKKLELLPRSWNLTMDSQVTVFCITIFVKTLIYVVKSVVFDEVP